MNAPKTNKGYTCWFAYFGQTSNSDYLYYSYSTKYFENGVELDLTRNSGESHVPNKYVNSCNLIASKINQSRKEEYHELMQLVICYDIKYNRHECCNNCKL